MRISKKQKDNSLFKNKGIYLRALPLFILIFIIVFLLSLGAHDFITLQSLQENATRLHEFVQSQPIWAPLVFISVYIASVALSLPFATLLTLLSGFLFGIWFGTLYVVFAATIGASILFLIAQSSFGFALKEKAGPLYHQIKDNMRENAIGYLFFMRLVPLFPFVVVNIVPALFGIPLRTFVFTTFFGIVPGSFIYVNLGKQFQNITELHDLVSFDVLIALSLLGLFALTPSLYKLYKKRVVL